MVYKESKINHFCCYIMIIWAFLPVLGIYQSSMLFQLPFLGAMAIWILTGLGQLSVNNRRKCLTYMIPYFMLMYFYVIIEYGNLNIPTSFDYALLFGFIVNGLAYMERPNRKFDKSILSVSLLLLLLTTMTTLSVLLVDGNASRVLTSSSSDSMMVQRYKSMNAGSYDFIYGLVILLPLLLFYSFRIEKKIVKILLWGTIALMTVTIVMSNFTTALMLLFLDIILVVLVGRKLKSNASFVTLFIVLAVAVPFLFTFFLNFVMQHVDSIYAQSKLEGILGIVKGEESYDETTSRSGLVMMSLKSFLESPIWGIGAYYGSGSPHVGQHAQFVDDLARYGLLGFIPLMAFFFYGLKSIYQEQKEKHFYNRKVLASILAYISLGFMNPIYNPGLLACMFVVVPVLDRFCNEKNKNIVRHRLRA